jgi:hypothetical protein
MDFQKYYKVINQEDTEISDDPWLDGKTHSLEVRNRPVAYILEVEEEEEEEVVVCTQGAKTLKWIHIQKMKCLNMNSIHFALERDQWWALVNTVMNFSVS